MEAPAAGGPLPIRSLRMGHLVDALSEAYRVLGFEEAAGGDEVFKQLVLAGIIEPTSKLDSERVLRESGLQPRSYRTLKRRLPVYATEDFGQDWRQRAPRRKMSSSLRHVSLRGLYKGLR